MSTLNKKSIANDRGWIVWPGYILFFMMLFVPTSYQPIKAVLLLLVLSIITISALLRGHLTLHPRIFYWTFFMMIVGLGFILRGVIHATPGALPSMTVFVLWPFVYTLIVAGVANEKILNGLLKLLIFATVAIDLYGLYFILYMLGWVPETLYVQIEESQGIGFYEGRIEYSLLSISSLVFLIPFLVGCLLTWPATAIAMPFMRSWLWAGFILGLLLVLMSGRRALLSVVVISPLITLILRQNMPSLHQQQNRKLFLQFGIVLTLALVGIFTYIQSIYNLELQSITDDFWEGFNFDDTRNISAYQRTEQFFALLSGWINSPLFGTGFGASAPGSMSSEEMPWAYELSYVALLFHTGIVGFSCYVAGVIWIYWMGLKIIRSGDQLGLFLLPILVGMSCFLIANATNPYLTKFDYIWVIFLPVAFINYWLLKNNSKSLTKSTS